MAEAFLSILLENMSSLIKDEIGVFMGVDGEMHKLASTLTAIQAVLEDAEHKQLESRAIQDWLMKLSDLTHEIDDILDECATHVAKWKHKNSSRLRLDGLKNILLRQKIGKRMKRVAEKLDAVAAQRAKFHLREMSFERQSKVDVFAARETGSTLNDTDHILGREDEKEEIVDILVNHAKANQEISILPILGLGGLGKTTLTQLVFQDQRVVEHFDKKLWVCVSDNFDVKTLIRAMIESTTGNGSASDLVHLEALECRISDLLNQKRYLLVLDDVWNDDQEEWFKLRNVLTCGLPGSSIIVTTRLKKVSEIMRTLPTKNIKGLSEEHCWLLLKHRAFKQGEEEQYPNLEAIGKQIVKKCAGVPLAAKALGGFLLFKRTEKEWLHVNESKMWDLPPEETLILPALKLSYHHLPLILRQCFTYCSIFPKDSQIHKKELIYLWMAHGYISSNGTLEPEDVGEQIWNELILRSLFQNVVNYKGETLMNTINMHDLLHDLAQSIMENRAPGSQFKRISTSASKSKIRQVDMAEHQVAFPCSTQPEMDISFILKNYTRLRVLLALEIEDLPSMVGNLIHLRYLNLSGSKIRSLPISLCNLWNLEMLNLDYCYDLVKLPKKMRCLKNLRHLFLKCCWSLRETPFKVGELTCLRTLGMFIVGCDMGNRLEELQCLNLGGSLEIQHLERVKNPVDAMKANLAEKHNLHKLCLKWNDYGASKLREDIDEKVLEALQPHPNLEVLTVYDFSGRHFPNWGRSLSKLVRVHIKHCQNLLNLYELEDIPHLEHLELVHLTAIDYLFQCGNVLDTKFLSLKVLRLSSLPNLKRFFKEEVGGICPNLQELTVEWCPSLVLGQFSPNNLEEWVCDSSVFLSLFSNLHNVESLTVKIGESMMCIPHESLECFTNLKALSIWYAHEHSVPTRGLQGLNSLQNLKISFSKTLTCLPKEWLSLGKTLKKLYIDSCDEFIELPEEIRYVDTLREIFLRDLPKMVHIPESIKHLSSLKWLFLDKLPELTSVPDWLGDLTDLRQLTLSSCPKLTSLPSCIQAGMTNLEYLQIAGCPNLESRYAKGNGEDWHKIAYIPHLYIGDD